jgi:hypothetical protein
MYLKNFYELKFKMDMSNLQPIQNKPALFIKKQKILVIADLHIGIESELEEKGLTAKRQTQKMTYELIDLINQYKPKDIILLGDVKHNIPKASVGERIDVRKFFKDIIKLGKIHIIPGNHDGNIKWFTPNEIIIHPSDGYIIDNIGFIHGHKWPKKDIFSCKQIIMAHTHPTVMLEDRLNYRSYEPCWIKTRFDKIKLKEKYDISKSPDLFIVPAFNSLCGGVAVNKQGIQGPIGKIINKNKLEIYLLDGTKLG